MTSKNSKRKNISEGKQGVVMKSSVLPSVPTFTCPDVKLPESFAKNKKRKTDDSSHSVVSDERKRKQEVDEFASMFRSAKELGASQLVGMAKKNYKEDRLTALGAPPAKQPTMPFAQKMGILAGRKKREERAKQHARESGIILAKAKKTAKGRSKSDKGLDVHTRGGVLHLKRDMNAKSFRNNRR